MACSDDGETTFPLAPSYSNIRSNFNFSRSLILAPITGSPGPVFKSESSKSSSSSNSTSTTSTTVHTPEPAAITIAPNVTVSQRDFTIRLHQFLEALLVSPQKNTCVRGLAVSDNQRRKWVDPLQYRSSKPIPSKERTTTHHPLSSRSLKCSKYFEVCNNELTNHRLKDPGVNDKKRKITSTEDVGENACPSKYPLKKARFSREADSSHAKPLASEPASKRKSRTLISAPNSIDRPPSKSDPGFSHPIIHPPAFLPAPPQTKQEMAQRRLRMLLQREELCRIADGLPKETLPAFEFDEESDAVFGIEPDLRREIVQWILEILPPKIPAFGELYNHLINGEETRFHATFLFSRYLLRVGDSDGLNFYELRMAREELIWEIAFSCLALASKFHHDFLYPLYPIYAEEFLLISPHTISTYQFEKTQKDILFAFNYQIQGVTPQAFYEELRGSLPSLQQLLDYRRPRRIIHTEMWGKLQQAVLKPDFIRFPVSILTAAALIEGIIVAFMDEYEEKADSSGLSPDGSQTSAESIYLRRAQMDVKPICLDIFAVLDITEMELGICREWLSSA